MKRVTLITLLAIATVACKKPANEPEIELTGCPVNTTCSHLYTELADTDSLTGQLKSGSYRVFWSEAKNTPLTTTLIIKAPMAGSSFTLGKASIIDKKVLFRQNCPTCDLVAFDPVDGLIKGQKATNGSWLIDATVILQSGAPLNHRDTLRIKDYFKPNFVLN